MNILDNNLKQRAYNFGLTVIKLCDNLPNKRSAWIIEDQLIRSSCSVGANLVEARSSSSRLEFKKFNEISLKSANEAIYWLMLLRDAKLSDSSKIDSLIIEASELCSMIATGVKKLKNKI